MRKQFKFYLSYFEIAQRLSDKDKLAFYEAILNKQFYGIEPKLEGIAEFAYASQKHSIDAQVKGYEDRVNAKLQDPTQGGIQGGIIAPAIEVISSNKKVVSSNKEYIKDIVSPPIGVDFDKLLLIYNEKFGRTVRVIPKKAQKQIIERLKEGYTKTDFVTALENAKNDQYHKDSNYKYITLEFISRPDKFERYSSNHNFKVQTKIL